MESVCSTDRFPDAVALGDLADDPEPPLVGDPGRARRGAAEAQQLNSRTRSRFRTDIQIIPTGRPSDGTLIPTGRPCERAAAQELPQARSEPAVRDTNAAGATPW
jgi:hypothetical protein